MNEEQFSAMLAILVPPVIERIIENSNIDEDKELSDEKSKLWHYSPLTLYTMYQDELLTGSYDYPEGA